MSNKSLLLGLQKSRQYKLLPRTQVLRHEIQFALFQEWFGGSLLVHSSRVPSMRLLRPTSHAKRNSNIPLHWNRKATSQIYQSSFLLNARTEKYDYFSLFPRKIPLNQRLRHRMIFVSLLIPFFS